MSGGAAFGRNFFEISVLPQFRTHVRLSLITERGARARTITGRVYAALLVASRTRPSALYEPLWPRSHCATRPEPGTPAARCGPTNFWAAHAYPRPRAQDHLALRVRRISASRWRAGRRNRPGWDLVVAPGALSVPSDQQDHDDNDQADGRNPAQQLPERHDRRPTGMVVIGQVSVDGQGPVDNRE